MRKINKTRIDGEITAAAGCTMGNGRQEQGVATVLACNPARNPALYWFVSGIETSRVERSSAGLSGYRTD